MAMWKRLIWDVESNGLLPSHVAPPFCMDRIHSLAVRCLDTGQRRNFVNDDLLPIPEEDLAWLRDQGHPDPEPLSVGVKLLMDADYLTGHNIVDFDIDAMRIEFPYFAPTAQIFDTLVMSRMVFADIKETDFRLAAKGKIPGRLIGQHGLEAWGERLGMAKGDYKKERERQLKEKHKEAGLEPPTAEALHHYVWGIWNKEMHDYMILDVDVNFLLWEKIVEFDWSLEAIVMEHEIHSLMVQQERNGFVFNVGRAEKLADNLRGHFDDLTEKAIAQIGKWYRPAKKHIDEAVRGDGEHDERRVWGDLTYPKRTISYAKANTKAIEEGDYTKLRGDTVAGAPMVKIELKEFNPNSRQQIEDRLRTLYGWEPQDFTESGAAKVDDSILRDLAEHIPLATTLAEIFFYKKRLGQVADGKNGWLKLVREDGRIHGRVNVGGTVSGRATHAAPNVSQVPGVKAKEFKDHQQGLDYLKVWDGKTDHTGDNMVIESTWKEKKGEWKILMRGREGDYGWDCRELFTVEPGYKLVGCDLSGIEFRCLGNLTFPFDDGEIIDVVLNGDIHQRNADMAGISRSVAKRLLYAAMYGGGDAKLGSIVEPFASEGRQKTLGKQLRAALMAAMPSLDKAIKEIKREKRRGRGTIAGLDGRRLYVRSDHAALNLRLQSDGALIAKKWCLITDDLFYEEGWDHGNGLEYSFCSWSHDEIQVAVREDLADRAAELMMKAAPLAGEHFNFKCPVAAEAQVGMNWAETH
ncbi:DNA polymerase I [Ruegeria phage RpAliso]|nr:DNA polymerase I [Ruegeria phage RpAliso]